MKKILLFTAAILFTFLSFSQSPNSFKYQTVVRDFSGNVIANQNVSFQLGILQGSASGAVVYTETHYITTNDFGLVNLNIGEGNTSDDFATIDWVNGPYFIQVEFDENGGSAFSLMGTSQLLSVPYAMYAKDVENKDDADADASNELVSSATLNGTSLEINDAGGTTIVDLSSLDQSTMNVDDNDADPNNELQTLSLSSNTLSLSDGGSVSLGQYSNLWQQNGTDIYYNNGWVGIGTDEPSGKMVVQGDASVDPDSALFEVKNKDGQTIFAVYDGGVRIWVDDTGVKANTDKGGFAVGGYRLNKSISNEYLRISPDSVRMYFDNQTTSGGGHAGGFAIQSFNGVTKSGNTGIMYLQEDNYFIGESSGINITTGEYNSTFGFESGNQLTSGSKNVFIGYLAGDSTTTGYSNNFIGVHAGVSNSIGYSNNFMGDGAGASNSSGHDNNFIGSSAGIANTIGWGNNFVGVQAGSSNEDGSFNNFIGRTAGNNNSSGRSNNFMGDRAGFANTTGNYNVFIGDDAGFKNTTGEVNNFIGSSAGWNNLTGSYNNFVGFQAGYNNTTGAQNDFIGYQAGYSNIAGVRNIFIGYHSGHLSNGAGLKDNIFIGDSAGYNSSSFRNIFIGHKAGMNNGAYENIYIGYKCGTNGTTGQYNTYVGTSIGENSTGSLNTFVGNSCAKSNTTGQYNVFMGTDAGNQNTDGSFNVFIGEAAGMFNTVGANHTTLGYGAGPWNDNDTNIIAIGYSTFVFASNTAQVGNSSMVSIGGSVDWSVVSDKRFKKNIHDDVVGLDFILKLQPVTYNLDMQKLNDFTSKKATDYNKNKENITYTGFLAQDVEKIAKELGYDFSGVDAPQNEKDHYGLRYATFVVPLVKAVQEQQEIIETQKTELELLKEELRKLSKKVDQLESK